MPRNYSNTAPPVALTVAATNVATTLTVASTTGYPAAPFLLGLERGTANEEVCLCTSLTATAFTVTRGYDNTTAKTHAIGTSVEHTVAAIDYAQAAALSRVPHTFAVPGVVLVPSGSTSYLPGMFLPIPAGALTATLVAVRAQIQAGTSATLNLMRNNVAIGGGGTGLLVTTTPTTTAINQALTADDYLNLAVTAVSGTPQNLSLTMYVDYGF